MSDLPKGWTEQLCGETFQQVSTTNIKVKNKETLSSGLHPVIDQGASKVAGYINDTDKVIKVKSPVCIFGDHTRIIKWIDFDFVPGADGTKILAPNSYLNERFFYHQLRSLEILDRGYSRHFKYLKESSFKVAPLNEQIRIADKLDSMLAKVDAAQARLDKIPKILKRFRQSVLAAATSGELTKEWRGDDEIIESVSSTWEIKNLPINWQVKLLPELGSSRLGKMLDKNKNVGIKTKYLGNINVRWNSFALDDLKEIKVSEKEIEELSIQNGDLIICEGGVPGRGAVWKGGNNNLVFQKALHRIRFDELILPEFALYCIEDDFSSNKLAVLYTGTTIKHLTGKALKSYPLKVPPMEEQKEIVRRVESLFTMADTVEKQYTDARTRTNRLTQSILAKAFRGELVPQDENDEPASVLLARIEAELTVINTKAKTKPKAKTA